MLDFLHLLQVLIAHLLHEVSKGVKSQWHPYIAQLPHAYTLMMNFGPEHLKALQTPYAQQVASASCQQAQDLWKATKGLLTMLGVVPDIAILISVSTVAICSLPQQRPRIRLIIPLPQPLTLHPALVYLTVMQTAWQACKLDVSYKCTKKGLHSDAAAAAGLPKKWCSLKAWLWASSTVCSRTMHVPFSSAGALTPFGDLHNYHPPPPPHYPEIGQLHPLLWHSCCPCVGY